MSEKIECAQNVLTFSVRLRYSERFAPEYGNLKTTVTPSPDAVIRWTKTAALPMDYPKLCHSVIWRPPFEQTAPLPTLEP